MAYLVVTQGPSVGQRFPLLSDCVEIGRQAGVGVYLNSLAVSRVHARLLLKDKDYFLDDAGSSNGTYLNNRRVDEPKQLRENDSLLIGPYQLTFRSESASAGSEGSHFIRGSVDASVAGRALLAQNPAYKLQVVLEIAQLLGHTLDEDELLGELLDHLLRLFPQADRGMVLLCHGEQFVVKAQRERLPGGTGDFPFSRTVVRKALSEGVGLLSEDVTDDPKLSVSATMLALKLRSFLCVPLLGAKERRLGVIQLDCIRASPSFRQADLEVLAAIGVQAATAIENAMLHAERLREERWRQELLLARDIQQSFLPRATTPLGTDGPEVYAHMHPAREVSGDLYDYFPLADGRLAFLLGDVSGKGMPAALFMIMVRTLARYLVPAASSPADLLQRLNAALATDNPTSLFVTLAHGIYDPRDNSVVIALGGHPPPMLRRADGTVISLTPRPGLMLGATPAPVQAEDRRLELAPGETLIFYTDGFTEAFTPDRKQMFGVERLAEVLAKCVDVSLPEAAEQARRAVERFTEKTELQDDQTLLLLRRNANEGI